MENTKYMNPYVAGVLLGLLLLATIYITGRGLGASGAIKSYAITAVEAIAPEHTANTQFYKEYAESHGSGSPLMNWLVFEVIGVMLGAFLSGLISDRLNFKLEKGPHTTTKIRIVGALTGGILWGVGSQLGRGCTSGAALSGMAVMSTGGIITMLAIFAGAYIFAYFFRKFWI
ncbi:YeeE/YedE family protein [candidate division KSB1 bacterium]|nr:YeeE/YedE family protein [candidate division KSB1 bacterium]